MKADKHKNSNNPLNKYLKFLIIAVILVGIAVAIYYAFIIFSMISGFQSSISECNKGRTHLFKNTQSITNDFNKLELVPSQPNVKVNVTKQKGDCVDSLPTIFATKEYSLNTNAGIVYDDMTSALLKNGYILKKDTSPTLNPCSYKGRPSTFIKSDQKIELILGCSSYGAAGDSWRQVPLTSANVRLSVAWSHKTDQ